MKSRKPYRELLVLVLLLITVNVVSHFLYFRLDLTEDKRYTLSNVSRELAAEVDSPLVVDVFLAGELPSEFRRLQTETRQLLEEFRLLNPQINYRLTDPTDPDIDQEALNRTMAEYSLRPAQVQTTQQGRTSSELVYPWALASFRGKTVRIPLLKNQLGATQEERVNSSVQNLEYALADAFAKLTRPKSRKVAVLKGNGEIADRYIADFFSSLRDYYYIAPFTLDSVASDPQGTLEALREYDLIVAAGPTEPFSDSEKYVLDQYIMNGGASLWLVDATENRLDSTSGNTFAMMRDLNLNDFFFKYGVRINPDLLRDVYSAPIVLATGRDRESQYDRYPWFYYPLSSSVGGHPIVSNIEAVKFDYPSSLDTLPNSLRKTILLSSSPLSERQSVPARIDMDSEIPRYLQIVNQGPDPGTYNDGEIPMAVLLEGSFSSAFANRIKPFALPEGRDRSLSSKMVVIGDAGLIRNQLERGRPLELGFDKWTQTFYGNKEFLLNCVNYLLDDSGLINIRGKDVQIAFLDQQLVVASRTYWQLFNILLPLGLLGLFGLGFQLWRRRSYGR